MDGSLHKALSFSLDTLLEFLPIHFGCVDIHPNYYHKHLKMCLVNLIHGCIVQISLCFVPDVGTLDCADYNGDNRVVVISDITNPGNVHIKDDTVFYTRANSR